MKVLLTGANSFVGKHLQVKLHHHEIIPWSHRDIGKTIPKGMDYIINLATYGNHFGQDDELETIEANYLELYKLLDITKKDGYKAFINFSTSSVNLTYQTFYSATKMAGEYLVKAFVNKYSLPVVSVRPATIYGTGDAPTHLIPVLFGAASSGERIDFVKLPAHDYIHVDDLVEAVMLIIKNASALGGLSVDIGTGIPTSNNHVKTMVEEITGKKIRTNVLKKMRPYDNSRWRVEPGILKRMGWKPKIMLKDGLIRYYKGR